MKRKSLFTCILLVMAMLVLMIPAVQAANISVIVNGRSLTDDLAPFLQYGRVLVPMRGNIRCPGRQVTWDASTQTVTGARATPRQPGDRPEYGHHW